MRNKPLKDRILYISQKYKLSHIGSCITSVDIIADIYAEKEFNERFVLSCGHSHLAHLVVKEAYGICDAEKEIQHDIHCNFTAGCDVATGSLGMGCTIALGMAMATGKAVWLLTSDGEMEEGSVWETLKIKSDLKINNLIWFVNANGFSALKKIDVDVLERRVHVFCPDIKVIRTNFEGFPFLNEISAHYINI